jgi:hypothetical protein
LFHAIVALGLGAASAGCGGQTGKQPPADAAEGTPSIELPEASSDEASFGGDDASFNLPLDADGGADASDASGDAWIPRPPVIA